MNEILIEYPPGWRGNPELEKDVGEKIYYLSRLITGFSFTAQGLRLNLEAGRLDLVALKEDALELLRMLSASYQRATHTILAEGSGALEPAFDAFSALVSDRQIKMTLPGVPALRGDFLMLLQALDRAFREYGQGLGACEQRYGTTLPTRSLIDSGYLQSFPQHALLVGAIHHDLDSLQAIAAEPGRFSAVNELDTLVSDHHQILAPTVCGHCFETLKEQRIDRTPLLVTAMGYCHRHEGRNHARFERLQTYSMREIVFFGDESFVRGTQERILAHCRELMVAWNMTWRVVVASDPFFATANAKRRSYQTALRLKYELQALLPEREEWIAIASFNHHQESLVKAYGISHGDDESARLNSGCFGVGLERLCFAVFAQKGLDTARWPLDLQRKVERLG
ncbi:MAG: hypothetical protein AB7O21_02130 [Gammaproteobacteria bacterium]